MRNIVGVISLLSLALIALVLGGCSTVTHKVEDGLCTGTKRPYQVKGNWYHPQHHYDYEETGTASWYGERFHGSPKSCGEVFNMHGISAAHKTLPIPSVVRVTNVNTGKSVKLLIDDRGPFIGDRIIDLSKGAAIHLGIHQRGLGKVCVECLPEESRAFARFVSKYGRYGRDPSGRTWEKIFRQHFDYEGCAPIPKPVKLSQSRRARAASRPSNPRRFEKPKGLQRSSKGRVMQISKRYLSDAHAVEKDIEEILANTPAY